MKIYRITTLLLAFILVACQFRPPSFVPIPSPTANVVDRNLLRVHYDPKNQNAFQIDLRSLDLSTYDLRPSLNDLLYSYFDTRTKWPDKSWLPDNFDPQKIIQVGKDPGLGVRELHHQGITGKGVSIAIIDMALRKNHSEYAEHLKLYETLGNVGDFSMHGPAVASIAAGKTVGVAPEANLYFIAAEMPFTQNGNEYIRNFTIYAKAVRRVIEINKSLPDDQKIRVLSISVGWDKGEPGYDEIVKAVDDAKTSGIFVVSSSLDKTYTDFKFSGLGRSPYLDPNLVESYEAGLFWAPMLSDPKWVDYFKESLLVPMDSRTYASYNGDQDYQWGRGGGWSWCIPYIAGLYAMAAQVKPDITPEVFWQALKSTSIPLIRNYDNKEMQIGRIIQPKAMIKTIEDQWSNKGWNIKKPFDMKIEGFVTLLSTSIMKQELER